MPTALEIDRRIQLCAARHGGIALASELHGLEVSRASIALRCQRGTMDAWLKGTYATGDLVLNPTRPARILAACLAYRGAATRQTAAACLQIWDRGPELIHVISTSRHDRGSADWFRLHRTRHLPREDVVVFNGIPCTSPFRTILDLAWELTSHQLAWVIGQSIFKHQLDLERLRSWVREHPHAPNRRTICEALMLLDSGSEGTRTKSEDELVRLLQFRPVCAGFDVNNASITGDLCIQPDFGWREEKLDVELDGAPHRIPSNIERDRIRDHTLRKGNWRVLRFESRQIWRDPQGVLDRIERELQDIRATRGPRLGAQRTP